MMRMFLALLIVLAGAVVALWQLDVVSLPFGAGVLHSQAAPPSLFELVKGDDEAALAARLAEGAEVDARDAYGQTPLMYAAGEVGDADRVRMLLDAGADPNAQSDAGWTPLMYAARDASDPQLVLLLMNAGADATLRDADGQSAYDLARGNAAVAATRLLPRLQELAEGTFARGWPSGYVVPVEGATLSSRAAHLPGAPRAYRNGSHEGFDFYDGTVSVDIEYGTPIRAVAGGRVVRSDLDYVEMTRQQYDEIITAAQRSLSTPAEILDRLRGRQVWIEHPGGFVSRYAHLSAIAEGVTVGAVIAQGQTIGATGNSGTVEATMGTQDDPHPHVEIWHGNRFLGQGLEPARIYEIAAQVFGGDALPPYTGE